VSTKSGQAQIGQDSITRLLPALHQMLVKPCSVATLRDAIERSCDGVDVERDAKIRQIIGGIDRLPTPPDVFFDLSRLLQSTTASASDVAKVVARVPALAAKVLQFANSGYFGAGKSTTSIQQAVLLLGVEQLRYLVLTDVVFTCPPTKRGTVAAMFSLEDMQQTSMRAAALARAFAEPAERDDVFAGALLRDLGHLVLTACRSAEFQVFTKRVTLGEKLLDVELDLFGATHADISARLLAIWGLPPAVVDLVQFHHDPGSAPEPLRRLAAMIHVADALSRKPHSELDMLSLERAGCANLVAGWRAIAASVT